MARMRTLKPEFWTDSKIVQLSPYARLLFMGAWNFADDVGVLDDDALQLKLRVLPADDVDAEALVGELIGQGLMRRAVTPDGAKVLVIPKFTEHQKPNRRSEPAYGEPDTFTYPSPPTHCARSESSVRTVPVVEGRGEESRGVSDGSWPDGHCDTDADTLAIPDQDKPDPDDGFGEFWDAYPPRDGRKRSKGQAQQQWRKLKPAERERALVGARHLAASGTLPPDAHRFLRKDRAGEYPFDDWQQPARASPLNVRDLPRPVRDEIATNQALDEWVRRQQA